MDNNQNSQMTQDQTPTHSSDHALIEVDQADDTEQPSAHRRGRFKPGQSGNPNGRRPGSKNFSTMLKAELGADPVAFVIRTAKKAAEAGDTTALRVLADRIWPVQRATMPLADVAPEENTLSSQGAAVLEALLSGTIAADVGQTMLSALQGQAKLIETELLADRVAALEAALSARTITS